MSDSQFESECDRLSAVVDPAQFERLRWSRHEGPMLARLVALVEAAIAERSDFEMTEEGASRDEKRFILKVHGTRIVALVLMLDGDKAVVRAEAIERGRYAVEDGPIVTADFAAVDAEWMNAALRELFGRIAKN